MSPTSSLLPAIASRVGVLTPTGRDAQIAVNVLGKHGIPAYAYAGMDETVDDISGGVGAVVIAAEALADDGLTTIAEALELQPVWSDVPVVLLLAPGQSVSAFAAGVQDLVRRGNVTLLERPVRVATLITALGAALRARSRQYEMRDAMIERARMVENERVLRGEAEEANMAKMQFLATMSHELRTPLNAIGGHVQLIQLGIHGPLTTEQKDALERVRRAESHLLGLINDVLNFAKIEAGHVTFDVKEVTMRALFEGIDALFEPQVLAKGLTYTRPTDCDDLVVMADLEKAQQILLNLLSNAVKFTEEGGTIALYCRPAGAMVEIDVVDTGVGVPAELLTSIFDPFVQVRPDYKTKNEGTGLGLAISRDLARAMKGELTARSELGKGSTFTLSLPRKS